MTSSFLIQLVLSKKKMWFIGIEVEQETSAPPPKKNPGSARDRLKQVRRGQIDKTFTSVIYKCSYCVQTVEKKLIPVY